MAYLLPQQNSVSYLWLAVCLGYHGSTDKSLILSTSPHVYQFAFVGQIPGPVRQIHSDQTDRQKNVTNKIFDMH